MTKEGTPAPFRTMRVTESQLLRSRGSGQQRRRIPVVYVCRLERIKALDHPGGMVWA
jgi:hypothetical protein